jgi:CD109 antigen
LVQEVHNWTPTISVYNVAIITYALHKASSQVDPSVLQAAYQRLMSLAITDEKGTHWKNSDSATKTDDAVASRIWCPMCNTGNSAEVEITSYGLLSILQKGQSAIGDAVGVAKWLSGQRNSLGGYYSTQDTVMGLQALAICKSHTLT